MPEYELVASTEPCAMCLGAIPWSGIRSIVYAARDEDARSCGFDEGAKPKDWIEQLEKRGILVCTDVLRKEAKDILEQYTSNGGVVYNCALKKK